MPNPITSAELKAIETGGLLHEEVLDKVFDISRIPLPFSDAVGRSTHKQERFDWVVDRLEAPDLNNAVVDGSDAGPGEAASGERVGNHSQTSTRVINVSHRSDDSDRIGAEKEFAYQLTRANQHIRRDLEAIALSDQASVPDDGNTTPGKTGALGSWIETSVFDAAGNPVTATGYDHATGKTTTPPAQTGAALSYAVIKEAAQSVYEEGGDVTILMARPSVIGKISDYAFKDGAPIASITADQGKSQEKAQALNAIQVIITDWGKLKLVPNRLQQQFADNTDTAYLLDTEYLSMSFLSGISGYDLAKTGLSNKKMLACDWGLRVHNERSQAMIVGIDSDADVVD